MLHLIMLASCVHHVWRRVESFGSKPGKNRHNQFNCRSLGGKSFPFIMLFAWREPARSGQ